MVQGNGNSFAKRGKGPESNMSTQAIVGKELKWKASKESEQQGPSAKKGEGPGPLDARESQELPEELYRNQRT